MRPVQRAFTLIEILVVLVIFFIIAVPLYVNVVAIRSRQHLEEAAEQLFSSLKSAHVYAREIKNDAGWGVDFLSENSFKTVYGKNFTDPNLVSERVYELNREIKVVDWSTKDVWFEKGTGEAQADLLIKLINKRNQAMDISIYQTGLIEKGELK